MIVIFNSGVVPNITCDSLTINSEGHVTFVKDGKPLNVPEADTPIELYSINCIHISDITYWIE